MAGTFCSSALLLQHLHLQLPPPSPHCFYLHSALSDGAQAWMQAMSRFCFLQSASRLGKQQYSSTHFVAKGMDASGGDPNHAAEGRVGGKPLCRDMSAWPLRSSLPPVQVPSHIGLVWKHPVAGSASWARARRALLICQPGHRVLHWHFPWVSASRYFLSLTLPPLSPSILLPWPPPCYPSTNPGSFSRRSIHPLPVPGLHVPWAHSPAVLPPWCWCGGAVLFL